MRKAIWLLAVLLPGCSPDPAKNAARDARDIAQVEAAQNQKPPAKPITPQPILFFDITEHRLYDSGCNFVASDGGMGAILLAQTGRAIIKVNDALVTLAADKGSKAMPQGSWSRYSGKEYALTLTRMDDAKTAKNGVVERFAGQVVITDPHDQVVYSAKGDVQCKPM